MLFFFSLIPATLAVVVGYFVLLSSAKSQGGVKIFGQILGSDAVDACRRETLTQRAVMKALRG